MIINTTCTITHTTSADPDAWYSVPFEYVTVLNVPQITVELDDSTITYGTDYTVGVQGLKLLNNTEAGKTLIIARTTPLTQETDFQTGMIDPDEIEHSFDLAAMRDQDIQAQVDKLADVPVDHEQRIDAIEHKIPDAASETNKLTDKNYVDTADGGLQTQITDNKGTMDGHIARTDNPHSVTKAQVGLGNCDNTADIDKPVSTAVQSAITAHTSRTDNPHSVTKAQVGLGNCDNTADIDKPISTAVQSALDGKITKNAPIIAGTKGMITYNSEGVVLGGREIYTLDLADVDTINPLDGQVLMYDDATHLWKPKTSTASISFDGVTGSPYDNTALAHELNIKTNCITEIPQDIKLELSSGTLTLKAGSKVWLPNGVGVFNEITIPNDLTVTDTQNRTLFIGVNTTGTSIVKCVGSETGTPVAGTYKYYYDDTENKCYQSGASSYTQVTFPIAIVTATSADGIVSIDQVFNGFGYIGYYIYVLPGVKGLIPNGRNADGTLSNTVFTVASVKTIGYATAYNGYTISLSASSIDIWVAGRLVYDEQTNHNINTQNDSVQAVTICGKVSCNGTQITSFEPNTVFHAVDYSDPVFVKTYGDQTIDGHKKFTSEPIAPGLRLRFNETDTNMGLITVSRTASDTSRNITSIHVMTASGAIGGSISLLNNSGSPYASAPASDVNNSIVTTVSKDKSSSGFFKLGNGLIIQWMCGISPAQDTAYSLPTAFTSGSSYSTVVVHATSGDDAFVTTPYSQTSTTVKFHRGGGIGSPYNVICIGY